MANFPNNAAFPRTGADSRSVFITRTYTHLVAGILGFILVELALFESGLAVQIAQFMFGFNWFLILGAFMLTGWLASRTAQTSSSIGMQYFAYAAYVVAEALIFVPLLYIADAKAPGTIDSATLITALGTGGLMLVAHRDTHVGRRARHRRDDRRRGVRFSAGHLVLGADDRLRRRRGAVRHLEHHPQLSRGSLRVSRHAAVRVDRLDVLVGTAPAHGQSQLRQSLRQACKWVAPPM
jgi:hypothetical protein